MTTETLARNDLIFENGKSPQQFFCEQIGNKFNFKETETLYYKLTINMVGLCLHEMTEV